MSVWIGVSLLVIFCSLTTAVKLDSYNVDTSSITVSGLSSGGAMAMQLHIAFSSRIVGSGVYAGLPWGCAESGLTGATMCMSSPGTVNVPNTVNRINAVYSAGNIDNPANVNGDNVFVFAGTRDTTVNPTAGRKLIEIYQAFGAKVESELSIAAVHGYPTDFYGAACGSSSAMTQYINNCNYHGAYIGLNYLLNGTLTRPTGSETLTPLITYEQGEFGASSATSMDASGFLYVPSRCADKTRKCKFHISLHGCQQYKATIGDVYATKTGYLQVAEANDIIVIFPQAAAAIMAGNPNGCWDWWGYLNANFLTKNGAQMRAINAMITRAAFCDGRPDCYDGTDPDPTAGPTTTTTTTTQAPGPTTTRDPTNPGCPDNDVVFRPFPADCTYYTMCACGANVLLQCAPGLVFDPSINNCNFMQLVACEGGVRP